jgi:hypothetical protein
MRPDYVDFDYAAMQRHIRLARIQKQYHQTERRIFTFCAICFGLATALYALAMGV